MTAPTSRALERWLLALLLIIAALHGVSTAFVRPMFQVSDEVMYFAMVQSSAMARATTDESRGRILGGAESSISDDFPGKPVYVRGIGALYTLLSGHLSPNTSVVGLRLAGVIATVFAVWACYLLARTLFPGNPLVVWGAPLVMALHPVFVATGAGITPDTFANAAAGWALVLLVRTTMGRAAWWEGVALAVMVGVAAGVKDTAMAVLGSVVAALAVRLWLAAPHGTWRVADLVLFALPAGAALAFLKPDLAGLISPSTVGRLHEDPLASEAVQSVAVADSLLTTTMAMVPSYFRSFWGELGNFGAMPLGLPDGMIVALAVVSAVALGGAAAFMVARPPWQPSTTVTEVRLTVLVLVAGCLTAVVLAPLRELAFPAETEAQGRWLFPTLGPMLVIGLAGLSWPLTRPGRVLPLFGLVAGTLSLAILTGVLISNYYVDFPSVYRLDRIYLDGTSHERLDPAAVQPFFERPEWLMNPWVAWAPIVGLVVALVAWVAVAYRLQTADGPNPPR